MSIIGGRTSGAGTPIPSRDRESKSRVNSEVTTYFMDPEEIKRLYPTQPSKTQQGRVIGTNFDNLKQQQMIKQLDDKKVTIPQPDTMKQEEENLEMNKVGRPSRQMIDRDQYLSMRASGMSRNQCKNELKIGYQTFYDWLVSWGIREIEDEQKIMEDYRVRHGLTVESLADFSDDAVSQIEGSIEEEPKGVTCDSQTTTENYKNESHSPAVHEPLESLASSQDDGNEQDDKTIEEEQKTVVSNPQTLTEDVIESAQREVERVASVSIEEIKSAGDPVDYIVLKFPIYNVGTNSTQQALKIAEEFEELQEEIETKGDRGRILHELFDLVQSTIHWIGVDVKQFNVGSTESDIQALTRIIQYHNNLHLQKEESYAADRGWEQFA